MPKKQKGSRRQLPTTEDISEIGSEKDTLGTLSRVVSWSAE